MSRKGDCWDNAPMESFFHTLKTELVHHRQYATRAEATRDIFAYIEGFYNRTRRHSAIGYISPIEMELNAAEPCPLCWGKITGRLLLGRKSGILLVSVGGGRAETSLGSGDGGGMGATQAHERPHLLIGDMPAGQSTGPFKGVADALPAAVTANEAPSGRHAAAGVPSVGLRPPLVTPAAAHSHPDCRAPAAVHPRCHEPLSPNRSTTCSSAGTDFPASSMTAGSV
jgi:hypothetical protein